MKIFNKLTLRSIWNNKTIIQIKHYINAISHAISNCWFNDKTLSGMLQHQGGQPDNYGTLFICAISWTLLRLMKRVSMTGIDGKRVKRILAVGMPWLYIYIYIYISVCISLLRVVVLRLKERKILEPELKCALHKCD